MEQSFNNRFLTSSDETGRFIVFSNKTKKTYYVEPIGSNRVVWGDVNPATGKVEGSYGDKYKGSIDEKNSLITKENGFKNIIYSNVGESPFSIIEQLDNQ